MNALLPLMQREWLQHRLGWFIAGSAPLALALIAAGFGTIQFGDVPLDGARLPAALVLGSVAGTTLISVAVLWITSLILASGISRRDHGDRSIEFWLSLPVGHAQSVAVPLFVHLLLVPLAALVVGVFGGLLLSALAVGRFAGLGSWFALPWIPLGLGVLAVSARLALGIVLATFWLLPVILAAVLLTAWFRRWGLAILVAGIAVGSSIAGYVFGQPWPADVLRGLAVRAGKSIINAGAGRLVIHKPEDLDSALALIPRWAGHDALSALGLLASPWSVVALLVSASLFALIVLWRRRGASAAN